MDSLRKPYMRLLVSLLLVTCAMSSRGQIPIVGTLSNLVARPGSRTQPAVDVLGYVSPLDWGESRRWNWDATNTLSTNGVRLQNWPGGLLVETGRWVHPWNGDVRLFGAVSGFLPNATDLPSLIGRDSSAAIQAAIDQMASTGGGVVTLGPGTYWITNSLYMKPRVSLRGTSAPNGIEAPRGSSGQETGRLTGNTYIEHYTSDGIGSPMLIFDGDTYYTNMVTLSFVNYAGETINYRYGANTVENIVFSCYRWGWGSQQKYPVAGVVIDNVASVTIRDCGFVHITGHGIWASGAFGLAVSDCLFVNCLNPSIFLTDTSDTLFKDNTIGGGQVIYHRANSHVFQNGAIWNPIYSLVTAGATTNVVEYGLTRTYGTVAAHHSDAATDEFTRDDGVNFAAGTGTLLVFRGSNPPAPFVVDTPYFGINGSSTNKLKLAATPLGAINKVAIDVQTSDTNGTWWLSSPEEMVYAWRCEEIFIKNNRFDQTYQDAIDFEGVARGIVDGNMIWELGTHQGPNRRNRAAHDDVWSGINIRDSSEIKVSDNLIMGGYSSFISSPSIPWGEYVGVSVTNSYGVDVTDNSMAALKYGIRSDAASYNVRSSANTDLGGVVYTAWSGNTNGNVHQWTGIKLNGTNMIQSSEIPPGLTNLNDFSVRMIVSAPSATISASSGDKYVPLFNLSTSTNHVDWNQATPGALRATLYSQATSTNWSLLVDIVKSQTEWRRGSADITEFIAKQMPLEMVIMRTNSNWQMLRNGYLSGLTMSPVGASPPDVTNSVHAQFATVGVWPLNLWSSSTVHEFALHNRAYPYGDIRDHKHRTPSTNAVFIWDFRGDTGSMVRDKSTNGVNATVTSLNGITFHEFGPNGP